MNMLKMCLNPKVIGVLALIAGLVLVFAPQLLLTVLPLLLLAACPLSMLLMGGAMMRGHDQSKEVPGSLSDRGAGDEVATLRAEVEDIRHQVRQTETSVGTNTTPRSQ